MTFHFVRYRAIFPILHSSIYEFHTTTTNHPDMDTELITDASSDVSSTKNPYLLDLKVLSIHLSSDILFPFPSLHLPSLTHFFIYASLSDSDDNYSNPIEKSVLWDHPVTNSRSAQPLEIQKNFFSKSKLPNLEVFHTDMMFVNPVHIDPTGFQLPKYLGFALSENSKSLISPDTVNGLTCRLLPGFRQIGRSLFSGINNTIFRNLSTLSLYSPKSLTFIAPFQVPALKYLFLRGYWDFSYWKAEHFEALTLHLNTLKLIFHKDERLRLSFSTPNNIGYVHIKRAILSTTQKHNLPYLETLILDRVQPFAHATKGLRPSKWKAPNAQSISITNSSITHFGTENFPKLRYLNLRLNELSKLDLTKRLIHLNVAHNNISSIKVPPTIKYLDLDSNNITNITFIPNSNLYHLSIKFSYDFVFDPTIYTMINLKYLDLSGISDTSLSSDISKLQNLKVLKFSSTTLQTLRSEICSLTRLEELYLSQTGLTYLPRNIGSLTNLRVLDISQNPINRLPTSFKNLKNLTFLDIQNTRFPKFPGVILKLDTTKIKHLFIDSTLIGITRYRLTENFPNAGPFSMFGRDW